MLLNSLNSAWTAFWVIGFVLGRVDRAQNAKDGICVPASVLPRPGTPAREAIYHIHYTIYYNII